jgi:hypothetical protein
MHPLSGKVNSPKLNFRFTAFSEVRHLSNSKDMATWRMDLPCSRLDT